MNAKVWDLSALGYMWQHEFGATHSDVCVNAALTSFGCAQATARLLQVTLTDQGHPTNTSITSVVGRLCVTINNIQHAAILNLRISWI